MHFNFYTALAAGLCVLQIALSVAAVVLCILLFRLDRNCGWLLLIAGFASPIYRVVWRVAHGLRPLWYSGYGTGPDGTPVQQLHYEFPLALAVAVVGLFMLYRKALRARKN